MSSLSYTSSFSNFFVPEMHQTHLNIQFATVTTIYPIFLHFKISFDLETDSYAQVGL